MKKTLLLVLLGLFCFSSYLLAQQRTISGRVTDASNGAPIPSVTIKVKESGTAVTTNNTGNYTIQAASGNTLLVTAVGYKSQDVIVGNNNVLNVFLTSSNEELEEVIVVAYGTADRKTFTGSAASVTSKDIKDATTISFENALIGKLPGVQITNTSGQSGSASQVRIRGIGSMNASNSPLYVIDGVPAIQNATGQMSDYNLTSTNPMNAINPADIESITVLKDAAAASLYGSRAANGIIIVTTKKGRIGKPVINFRSSVGFTPDWATDNYEKANPQDQIDMLYQVFHDYRTSAGWDDARASADAINRLNGKFRMHGYYFEVDNPGLFEQVQIKGMTDGIENREGQFYDWDKELFRTGVYQTNDLSVSGGNEGTRYYTSLAYTTDKNRMVINEFDRITGRANLSQKINNWLQSETNISISHNEKKGFNDTRNLGLNYFLQSRNLLFPLYWPTDYKTGKPFTARYGSYAYNPVYYEDETTNSAITSRVNAIQSLSANLFKGMNLKTVFSYEMNNIKDHFYYSPNHFNGVTDEGTVSEMATSYRKLLSSTTANYNTQIATNHGLDFLVGFEAEANDTDFTRAKGTNLPSSQVPTVSTAGKKDANAYSWGNNMMSVFSRVEYNYANRYHLSGSFRSDGSSRMSPEVRWGNFWSAGASWILSEEAFLKDNTFINNLSLKASYGINGTTPTSDFGWRNLISFTSPYMESPGGGLYSLGNTVLTWETNYNTNVGLDFTVLNNRLYGTVEWFNRDSKDVLQSVQISRVTGFSSILRNIGDINNNGLEVSLGYDILRNDNLRWSVNANVSAVKSKVTKLYRAEGEEQGQDIIWYDPTGNDARAGYVYREGESMLAFYGYEWAGVNPENGENVWYVNDPDGDDIGDFDYNGRGATSLSSKANKIILGSAVPKAYGGFNTDVEYKGIALGLNFNYKIGGQLYDGAFKDVGDDGYYWERIRSQYYMDNRWTEDNTGGSLPKLSGLDWTDAMQISNRQMFDASYLRLKNVTLAYSLPASLLNSAGIANARIYFNGSNLLTFSEYKIADPEVNNYGTRGWETPIGKTYTFGLEFSF